MSSENKRLAADLLFWFQLVMAWSFTVPQIVRSLHSTGGMTITWSVFCSLFVLINLFLALGAYRQSASRKALQIVLVYTNWLILWIILFVIISLKGVWTRDDTIVTILIVIAVIILLVIRRKESLIATISEPITRGTMSLIVKSAPQLFIAYCIVKSGRNDGLAGITLLIGHITVLARVAEICIAAKQDGWNRKNIGLAISETGNELTWCVTTTAWLAY